MNSQPIIELVNVSKKYQTNRIETTAVSDVSLSLAKNDYLVLTGESGCGKSTLLSLLGLLDTPTSGAVLWRGKAAHGSEATTLRNRELGYIFQGFNLINRLTALENILLPVKYRRDLSSREALYRATSLLNDVGLMHRKDHFPLQLSGGQQQRVAYCRAMIASPCLLLGDEPTGNLDQSNSEGIMQLIRRYHYDGGTGTRQPVSDT